MAEFESDRRSAIPRDLRWWNAGRIARQYHRVSLLHDDVITRAFRHYARRHCVQSRHQGGTRNYDLKIHEILQIKHL